MRQLIIFILAISLLSACKAGPSRTEGLLWEISGNGLKEPSYLFGTHHDVLPFFLDNVQGFDKAFSAGKRLILEIDPIVAQSAEYIENFFLPKGITYSDLLSKEDYNTLDSVLQIYVNVSADNMNRSPGELNFLLLTIYTQSEGEKWKKEKNYLSNSLQNDPLDMIIYKMAQEKAYPIVGLETNQERSDLGLLKAIGLESEDELNVQAKKMVKSIRLFNTPLMLEAVMLRAALDLAYYEQQLPLLESANGRLIEFTREYALELGEDSMDSVDEKNDIILKKRNLLWMKKIPALIQNQPSFIAVGALHLVGEYGLINLLRKEGFVVEPVN